MEKKPIAVKCTTEREFNAVKEYIIKMEFEPLTKNMIPAELWGIFKPYSPGDRFLIVGDGYYWVKENLENKFEAISFYTFTMLTGFKATEAPKEVILKWGTAPDVTVTVRHSHIKFEFTKTIVKKLLSGGRVCRPRFLLPFVNLISILNFLH